MRTGPIRRVVVRIRRLRRQPGTAKEKLGDYELPHQGSPIEVRNLCADSITDFRFLEKRAAQDRAGAYGAAWRKIKLLLQGTCQRREIPTYLIGRCPASLRIHLCSVNRWVNFFRGGFRSPP